MKRLVNKIKKKLNDTDLKGVIDLVSKDSITGWVSYKNDKPIEDELDLFVDGILLTKFRANLYREDLKDAGIAKGKAGFSIQLSSVNVTGALIEIRSNKKLIIEHKNISSEKGFKNKDPFLEGFIKKLSSKSNSMWMQKGLSAKVISSADCEKEFAGNCFVRFSNSSDEAKSFTIGQAFKTLSASDDYFVVYSNSNRQIEIAYTINRSGTSIFTSRDSLGVNGWNKFKVKLPVDSSLSDGMEITITIPSKSYFDLGALGICNSFLDLSSTKKKILSEFYTESKNLIDLKISSDESQGWKQLQRKESVYKELQYEDKSGKPSTVLVDLSKDGLSIKTEKIDVYARFAMPIRAGESTSGAYNLSFYIDQSDPQVNVLHEAYIYEVGGTGRTLNKIRLSKTALVDGLHEYRGVISEDDLYGLIVHSKHVEEIKLAIQLIEGYEFVLKSILFTSDTKKQNALVPQNDVLEDDAITGQLGLIKGFDHMPEAKNSTNSNIIVQARKVTKERVDVVIPIFNAKDYVLQCIDSIKKNTTVPFRIIAVDDCSTDGVYEELLALASRDSRIEVFRNERNVGYTGNVNKGIGLSNSEWVVLLNSDTVVTPMWLENMLEVAQIHKNCAIVGPLGNAASWQSVPNVFNQDGQWDFNVMESEFEIMEMARLITKFDSSMSFEVGVLNGFCQLIKRQAFIDVGALDEDNFPRGYGEENDLCARLVKNGHKLICAVNSYVYHHKSKSFGHEERSELSKKGSGKLKELHPDYDWGVITKKFYSEPKMGIVRSTVKEFIGE